MIELISAIASAFEWLALVIGYAIIGMCLLLWTVIMAWELLRLTPWVGPHFEPERPDEPVRGPERDSLNDYVDATEILYHDYDNDHD